MHRECILWTLYDTEIPQNPSWINSGKIIFSAILDVRGRPRDYVKGSGPRPATALIPSERASKTMIVHVEFVLFHGFHVEISGIKGGPGTESGGWGLGQSGVPW